MSLYDACFSPGGRHILLEFESYAVVLDIGTGEEQFLIKCIDSVFIRHDGRIASTHWIDNDGNSIRKITSDDSEDGSSIAWEGEGVRPTRIVVKLWDASSGSLMPNRLFEVNDVARTRFSPDGRFLAVARKSDSVIELWNVKDGKDLQRFLYPPGHLKSPVFSPTSNSLMAVSWRDSTYVWRLDTQEMASFDHHFDYVPRVIHSPLTNYLFTRQDYTVKIWDVSMTGSKQIWETNPPATSSIYSICPSRDGHRLLVGCGDGSVRMWELDLENLAMNQADTMDTQADADTKFIAFS